MSVRVLHVIPAVAPQYGGPSVAVIEMSRAVQALGAEVAIVTTDANGPARLAVELNTPTSYGGVRTIFQRRILGESLKWSPGLARWTRAHVREFDVVHIHAVFSHSTLAAGRACTAQGVPYVVRPLGTLDPWSLAHHRRRKALFLTSGLRRVLARATAMHYTSDGEQQLAESTSSWLPPGRVVPLGVEDACFIAASTPDRERTAVVTMCRLDPKKGVDLLIDAFHRTCAAAPDRSWRLQIAGDGDPEYVRSLRRLASDGPGAPHIEFCGWLTGAARTRLLASARVFVLASHQENFGLSVAEAMAASCPVIVTSGVNLAADIARAEAGWVVPRDVESIVHALEVAWTSAEDATRRGERARQYAEQFRWPRIGAALITMYGDIRAKAR